MRFRKGQKLSETMVAARKAAVAARIENDRINPPHKLTCCKCGVEKPIHDFPFLKEGRYGRRKNCRLCKGNAIDKRKANERARRHVLARRYQMTEQDYQKMAADQSNVCFICHKSNGPARLLDIDHDHETGKVRSLLCSKCNSALGWARDNAGVFDKLIDYLG